MLQLARLVDFRLLGIRRFSPKNPSVSSSSRLYRSTPRTGRSPRSETGLLCAGALATVAALSLADGSADSGAPASPFLETHDRAIFLVSPFFPRLRVAAVVPVSQGER